MSVVAYADADFQHSCQEIKKFILEESDRKLTIIFNQCLYSHYREAKRLAESEMPSRLDLIFLGGKKFDVGSTLTELPVEIIFRIFQLKYAAFNDYQVCRVAISSKIHRLLFSFEEDLRIARREYAIKKHLEKRGDIQSEINPCSIS